MADLAGATLTGKESADLSKSQRALLASVRNGHLDHATSLRSPEPTSRPKPASGTPAPPGEPDLDASLASLIKRERAAARSHARATLASSGFPALLWASMSVAATSYASALGQDAAVPVASSKRRPLPDVAETKAVTELVTQLHAVIYGYQLAIGQFPVLSKRRARAVADLLGVRILRERLISILTRRSADVPVPEAAYVPSVRVHDVATAGRLIAQMQTALLPFCGLFVAAAENAKDRSLAFDTLAGSAKTARSWGAPITAWPGWP